MSKKTRLKVVQKDLIENIESVIFDGYGKVNIGEITEVKYEESTENSVHIELSENTGFLNRSGEANTEINFNLNEVENASINTQVGEIFLTVKTSEITLNSDNLMVAYELSQAGNVLSDFIMKVEWINE